MKTNFKKAFAAAGAATALAGTLAFPAAASSYYEPGKGTVAWDYSLSLYSNYKSQHLRFGYGSDGHTTVRYGDWAGEGHKSVAPLTNFYSQYSYGANWRQLW